MVRLFSIVFVALVTSHKLPENVTRVFDALHTHRRLGLRRLNEANVMDGESIGKLCKSVCWNKIVDATVQMYEGMEENGCNVGFSECGIGEAMCPDTPTTTMQELSEGDAQMAEMENTFPVMKLMGQCSQFPEEFVEKCKTVELGCSDEDVVNFATAMEIARTPPAEGQEGQDPANMCGAQCNPCMKVMLASQAQCEKAATCTSLSLDMLCDSMCADECVNDEGLMGMMMRGDTTPQEDSSGESDDGVEDNENPGEVDSEAGCTQEDGDAEGSPAAAFEFMCMENTEKGFFCFEKMLELENTGAFSEDNPSDTFPNLCAINCDTATGKAIKELGCCAAGLIEGMEKSSGGDLDKLNEVRIAKAVAWKCGGPSSMTICGGGTVPTKIIACKETVASCPVTKEDETKHIAAKAKDFNLPVTAITISICSPVKCSGRRLGARGLADETELHYNIKVSAKDESTLKTLIDAIESNPNFTKSEGPAASLASSTSSAGSTSIASSSGASELGLSVLALLAVCTMVF